MTSHAANPGVTMDRQAGTREGGAAKGKRQNFGRVLRDLLIEHGYVTQIGNPNWMQFSHELEGIQYESLRKAVTREREPSRVSVRKSRFDSHFELILYRETPRRLNG